MRIRISVALGGSVLAAPFAATPALGQAFTQEKGHGRVITTVLTTRSDKGFNDRGNVTDIADYHMTDIFFAAEYGVTDDLTLLATPSLRDVTVRGGDDSRGLGYTDLGARYRFAHGGNFVVSAQALARIPGTRRRDVQAQVGSTDAEYDLRVQGGYTFGKGSFAILEGGYRWRAGDPPNAVNIDATLGIRAAPRLLLLASSFNAISDGAGRGIFRRYRFHNLFLSGAYDVSRHITLQLGATGTVAGRNALRERGGIAGLWFRF